MKRYCCICNTRKVVFPKVAKKAEFFNPVCEPCGYDLAREYKENLEEEHRAYQNMIMAGIRG